MARWAAIAKWAAGPALDGQRDMPLALRLSEGLGISTEKLMVFQLFGPNYPLEWLRQPLSIGLADRPHRSYLRLPLLPQ